MRDILFLFFVLFIVLAPDDKNDTVASRNDFINYFLSLMRSHSSENGDDLPVIEFGTLKSLIYVADAYLLFIDMLEKIDSQIAANQEITKDAATCDKQIIDMFQKDELVSCISNLIG